MAPDRTLPPLPDYTHRALIGFRPAAGTLRAIDSEEESLSVGEVVRRRREMMGYTRISLARMLYVKPSVITSIETRPGYIPPRSVLAGIEDLLAIDRRKFLE